MANNSTVNVGAFVPTTNVWDVSQIYQVDVKSPEFKELLVRLYQNLNIMSSVLNVKDSGYYTTLEFVNGQLYFPNPANTSQNGQPTTYRQVYRTTVNFGQLPNAGVQAINHNIPIDSGYSFTRIYATASDQVALTYLPIPYVSVDQMHDIQIDVTSTQVIITTQSNRSNYTKCYVVLEYIKF